ncbi:MAG: hypothetical protein Tsb009_25320 [Planctomycetaceae bacterium]
MTLWLMTRNLELLNRQQENQRNREIEHLFWIISREGASAEERTNAFKRLVAAGNNEWRIAHLKRLDLRGMNLSKLEFRQASFEDCDFREARLNESKMFQCEFTFCKLQKADLQDADLSECQFFKANLSKANLQLGQFRKANLDQATVQDANLRGSDFSEAFLTMTDLTNSDLTAAKFIGANMRNANLTGANLQLAIFPPNAAALQGVNFKDSNWWRARGLPTSVLLKCRKQFKPTEKAKQEFRDDYQLWLKTDGATP